MARPAYSADVFGRKKHHDDDQPPSAPPAGVAKPPGQAETLQVLAAFMNDPSPPASATPPSAIPPGAAPPPPLAPGQKVGDFTFNIETMQGSEANLAYQGPRNIPVPGLGMTDQQAMAQAMVRIEAVIKSISNGGDLSEPWTVDRVHRAQSNLDVQRAALGLTDAQYEALKAALASTL